MFRRSFVWLTLLFLVLYVMHVEPNAKADPIGATTSAFGRLYTLCDREKSLCDTAKTIWTGVGRAGQIGYGLATGGGSLVYVPSGATTISPSNDSVWRQLSRSGTGFGASGGNNGGSLPVTSGGVTAYECLPR